MSKVLIVNGNSEYRRMFLSLGWEVVEEVKGVGEKVDLICFTGGEDVSPHLYNEKKHPLTHNSHVRDEYESQIFRQSVEADIPMVGICRGGQFLNVMNGGQMFQHVTNHCGQHYLRDVQSNMLILVSSTHHQMMRPGPASEVVATADEFGIKEHMPQLTSSDTKRILHEKHESDTEVVFYPNTRSLCFQPHPEFTDSKYQTMREYFFALISQYLSIKENKCVA